MISDFMYWAKMLILSKKQALKIGDCFFFELF